jgi:hypothetical protein
MTGLSGFGTGLTALAFWLHVVNPVVAAALVAACSQDHGVVAVAHFGYCVDGVQSYLKNDKRRRLTRIPASRKRERSLS